MERMANPSSKVIKPPGGQSQLNLFHQGTDKNVSPVNKNQAQRNASNVFNYSDPEPVIRSNKDRNASSIIFGAPDETTKPKPETDGTVAVDDDTEENEELVEEKEKNENENETTDDADKEVHYNESTEVSQTCPPQRSSTRVMAPPGGKCSILFG